MDTAALALLFLLLALGAVLSAIHACMENVTGASLESQALECMVKRGGRRCARSSATERIVNDLTGHGQAVALMRILSNLGVAVCAVFVAASLRTGQNPTMLDALIGVLASAVMLWIFSVSVAESIGTHAAEQVVYFFSPLVRALYLVQRPLVPISKLIDSLVRLIAGTTRVDKQTEVAEDILSVVEEGEREGAIDEEESRMIEAVVDFKNRTVEQIMTPRNDIEALEFTNNLGQITAFVRRVRHSRVPVYRVGGNLDQVIGLFYVKDLLRWLAGDGPRTGGFELKAILRPAPHVPSSKTIRALADEFRDKKVHAAVVVDEYGSVVGMVTMEDIIEDIFGDIQDEFELPDDAPPRIELKLDKVGDGEPAGGLADIDARAYVADANEALEPLGVSVPEGDDYDTVGGFVLQALGHMPEVNETFNYGRMLVTVLESTPTRVLKVRVQVRPPIGGFESAPSVDGRSGAGGTRDNGHSGQSEK